jgi:hypothetical protein
MGSEQKKERDQKDQIAQSPNRDDVHEQRDANQENTSIVPGTPRKPTQTQSDRERADWEGMGQPQSKPGA